MNNISGCVHCTGMVDLNYCFKITLLEGAFVPTVHSGAICKGSLLDENSKKTCFNHGMSLGVTLPCKEIRLFGTFLYELAIFIQLLYSYLNVA